MTERSGIFRTRCPGHRAPKRLRSLGGGLRSWLAVQYTFTAALRSPGVHSLRSRHSRAAASAPASLPSLTVPQRVRFGRAPRRKRRIDPLGARPLRQRTPGGRPHFAPSCGCFACNAPRHEGVRTGFAGLRVHCGSDDLRGPAAMRGGSTRRPVERGAGGGERNGSERAEVASVAEGNPPREPGSPQRKQPPPNESRWGCAPLRGRHIPAPSPRRGSP